MNVLVLTPAYPNPGNEAEGVFNEQHTLALGKLGVEATVVHCKPVVPPGLGCLRRYSHLAHLPAREERRGIDVHYARHIHLPGYRFAGVTVGSCARSILRAVNERMGQEKPDLIQCHSVWPVGLAAPLVAGNLGVPFVVTLHIRDDARLHGTTTGRGFYRRMIERASCLVAVGTPLERFVREELGGNGSTPLRKIPNGVDLELAREAQETAKAAERRRNVVSIGNLWPSKGIDLNLRALAILEREKVPWDGYLVIGDGPERSCLERLAGELGIANKVEFAGRLDHAEAVRRVAECAVFSLPSSPEAFGVAYLEAMGCGLPAVGCRGEGAEDIIRDGVDGFLVEPGDAGGLSVALRRLLTDTGFVAAATASVLDRARQFSWERTAGEYLALYTGILGG